MPATPIARRALLGGAAAYAAFGSPAGAAAASKRSPRLAPARQRVVAIDPGHGGADPGAISPGGLYEKQITLAVAAELARQLGERGTHRAVLTRRRDVYIPLRDRFARARLQQADLLLSIHADALPDSSLRGLSVYTLSDRASDRETAALAQRENKDDFVGGLRLSRQPPEISQILLDLARRQTNNRSLWLAQTIVGEMGRTVPLLEKPHRSAGFVVLTAPDVPSVLVELGCLSNPREEQLLQQASYRQRLAQGLARAVGDYFASVA